MPPLNLTIRPVSGYCNLRCAYCFFREELAGKSGVRPGRMADGTLDCVVQKALEYANGECTVTFSGGEPTLAGIDFYRRYLRYEEKYNRRGLEIRRVFETNGYALNEEWCRFLAENNFLVVLSMDGIRVPHDQYRRDRKGEGTYFRALAAIERLQKAGAESCVRTVVNQKTAGAIWKTYTKYRKLGLHQQRYEVYAGQVGQTVPEEDCALSPKDYGRFLVAMFELWSIDLRNGCQPRIGQFEDYIRILSGQEPESCMQCGACAMHTVVEPNGSVYPCSYYIRDGYCLGNLNHDSMETVQERFRISRFTEKSAEQDPKCQKCRFQKLCRGGCRRQREMQEESLGRNYYCEGYRLFFETCIGRMKEIAR